MIFGPHPKKSHPFLKLSEPFMSVQPLLKRCFVLSSSIQVPTFPKCQQNIYERTLTFEKDFFLPLSTQNPPFPEPQKTLYERSLTLEESDALLSCMQKSSFPEVQQTLHEHSLILQMMTFDPIHRTVIIFTRSTPPYTNVHSLLKRMPFYHHS